MNLTIERNTLLAALTRISTVVAKRSTIPIISHVLIDTRKGGEVILRATNLDAEATVTVRANVIKQGAISVSAELLLNIAKNADEGSDIAMEMKDQRLAVKSGKSRFNLATLPAIDFPTFSALDDAQEFIIAANVLHDLFDRVSWGMANDQAKFILCGVHIFSADGRIGSVATNTHRMAVYEHDFDGAPDFGVIVPALAVRHLVEMTAGKTDDVRLSVSKAKIKAIIDGEEFTSKLVEGQYLDFRRVQAAVMDQELREAVLDVAATVAAIRRIVAVADDNTRSIILTLSHGLMSLAARGADADGVDEVEITYDGPETRLPVNSFDMLELLASVGAQTVTLMLGDPERPFAAKDDLNDGYAAFLAPLRI